MFPNMGGGSCIIFHLFLREEKSVIVVGNDSTHPSATWPSITLTSGEVGQHGGMMTKAIRLHSLGVGVGSPLSLAPSAFLRWQCCRRLPLCTGLWSCVAAVCKSVN